MRDARTWLDAHQRAAPPRLRSAMDRALSQVAAEAASAGAPERLAEAGLEALRGVIRGSGGRASAVELLAADALLTAACQAAAEEGSEALEALTDRLLPGRFERLGVTS